jgi:hypothetical protein
MSTTGDQELVGAFSPGGAHPAFSVRICAGSPGRRLDHLGAGVGQDSVEGGCVFGVSVADQEPERPASSRSIMRLRAALGHPLPGRVLGHSREMHAAGGDFDGEEDVDLSQPDGVDGEEVHCQHALGLASQECGPGLVCAPRRRVDPGRPRDPPDRGR